MKITKNIIVFYHEHCSDGFAGSYIAYKKFKNKADYIALSHTADGENILISKKIKISELKDKEVYFIDFCLNEIEMRKIQKVAKKLIVIDHHIGKEELVKSIPNSVFRNGVSGAYLAHEYFFPKKEIPKLVKYISIGDTWTWGQEKFEKEILGYISTLDFDFKTFAKVEKDLEDKKKFLEIKNIGEILKKNYTKLVKNQVENAKLIDFDEYKVYAVNSSRTFKSELGHILSEKTKSFALVYTFINKELYVSLRGDGKINLAELAKKYGGGGHAAAASFKSKDEKFIMDFVKKIIG
jgi:oligoribonuclease NrnB/cAMP/cGMP phosphodiesterase (DHH superfamily)